MKTFLAIVLTGVLCFLAVGVVQEWPSFAAELGLGGPETPPDESLHRPARAAVRRYLLLSRHLYSAGFDKRFAERIGASDALLEELKAEIDYLRHRGWVQQARLVKLELEQARTVGPDRVEVTTREYWIIGLKRRQDKRAVTRSSVARCRYRVKRVGSSWVVDGWEFVPAVGQTASR